MPTTRYFCLALGVHLILLLCIILNIYLEKKINKTTAYIHSYAQTSVQQQSSSQDEVKKPIKKIMEHKKLLPLTHQTEEKKIVRGNKEFIIKEKILAILHTAIAAKQQYPESALELHQTGKVTLHFILSPTGHLLNVTIDTSSGINSIDQAALMAVRAISPLPEVGHYLKIPTAFSVDVIFE